MKFMRLQHSRRNGQLISDVGRSAICSGGRRTPARFSCRQRKIGQIADFTAFFDYEGAN